MTAIGASLTAPSANGRAPTANVSTFLSAVLPAPAAAERIELRCIAPDGALSRVWARTIPEAVEVARPYRDRSNIYYGVALRDGEHGDQGHISRFSSIWCDVDGKCFPDGKDGALAAIETFSLPPSVIVDTGGGYHPYWLLVEPHDQEDIARARAVMRGIADELSQGLPRRLDAVHDLSRVLRLPASFNLKGSPVPVRIVSFDADRRYNLSDFIDAGLYRDEPVDAPLTTTGAVDEVDAESALLHALRGGLPPWVVGALEEPAKHVRRSESELDIAVLRALLLHLPPHAAEAVWLASVLGSREKTQQRPDYRRTTLQRALAANGAEGATTSLPTSGEPVGGEVAGSGDAPQTSPPTIGGSVGGEVGPRSPTLLEVAGDVLAREGPSGGELPSLPLLGQPGYIIKGWSHLLSGYPRCGKTELLVRLVREWCGDGEEVVYLTEEPRSIWQARLAALAGDWSRLRVVFGLGAEPERLMQRAFGGTEPIIVIDTLRNLLRLHDETDNSEVARVLNPWIARAREKGRTLVVAHHNRKGGGEHGEGIAGGHALLGVFDIALEIGRDSMQPRRRTITGHTRLITTTDLVYEMGEGGSFAALGDPAALALGEVGERVYALLGGEWRKSKEIVEELDEPKPSGEQVRQALVMLARKGRIERDPPIAEQANGKTHRWRVQPPERPQSEPPQPQQGDVETPIAIGVVGREVGEGEPSPVLQPQPPTDPPMVAGEVCAPTAGAGEPSPAVTRPPDGEWEGGGQ